MPRPRRKIEEVVHEIEKLSAQLQEKKPDMDIDAEIDKHLAHMKYDFDRDENNLQSEWNRRVAEINANAERDKQHVGKDLRDQFKRQEDEVLKPIIVDQQAEIAHHQKMGQDLLVRYDKSKRGGFIKKIGRAIGGLFHHHKKHNQGPPPPDNKRIKIQADLDDSMRKLKDQYKQDRDLAIKGKVQERNDAIADRWKEIDTKKNTDLGNINTDYQHRMSDMRSDHARRLDEETVKFLKDRLH